MHELNTKILSLFQGDNRKVMQQLSKGYGINHLGPLSLKDVNEHIIGTKSNAIYLLDQDQNCATVCFDIDIPKIEIPESSILRASVKVSSFLPEVKKIINYLRDIYHLSNEHFLIEDTGGRGYHIWAFFSKPVPGERCVTFMNDVKLNCGFSGLEIFPPAFNHGSKGFSKSLVRLPLGLHRSYANSRSNFLDPNTFEPMPFEDLLVELNAVKYLEEVVLNIAEERYSNILKEKVTRTEILRAEKKVENLAAISNLGKVGDLVSMCPAFLNLIYKAKNEGNLKHHERFALAAVLKNFQDGESFLHEILSNCDNYDLERSSYQISTVKACALSCKKLQSPEYAICSGWCNSKFKESDLKGGRPSPIWFAELNRMKEEIALDDSCDDISQVATVENLSIAWKKAKRQAVDRDIFNDKLAFNLFEKDLWNNLAMLGIQLKEGKWKHNNFLSIKIPKDKASGATRPFCSISVRESIVQLAVMNVIGPKIDSRFHPRSLGNRLAISPKSDDQIFQDWRKQNAIREFKKNSFSEYEPHNHYALLDIRKFYEFIKHDKLLLQISQFVQDQSILDIIEQYIKAPWERTTSEYGGQKKVMGIPQGPALSALLSNIYFNDIDHWLSDHCIDFVRYVDDLAILFEDKETADIVLNELEEILSLNYGLSLNTEKTIGPLPITDNEKLSTWLDRVRYDFVRSGVTRSVNLTQSQKSELFDTLTKVAGSNDEDPRTLTKSLGFYVRFSEALDSEDLTNTVYKVAEYLLEEDRPRHNATCIAVRSLIKASNEPKGGNWQELKSLMDKRGDEYFKIVFAQECAGLLESVEDILLRCEIVDELCNIAVNKELPAAAAAAINTLLSIAPEQLTTLNISDLKAVGFGEHEMLRPRAIALLFHQNEIAEDSLARITVKTLFEIEVYSDLIKESAHGLFTELVHLTANRSTFQLCLPFLVRKGILLRNREGTQLFSMLNSYDEQKNVAYYIADKIIADLVGYEYTDGDIIVILEFLKEIGEITIATEIYQFAKYSKWLKDSNKFSDFETSSNKQNYSTFNEPFIEGTEILGPLFESNRFVHRAKEMSSGTPCFHEVIKDQELAKSGRNLKTYFSAFTELNKAGLLLDTKVEMRSAQGKLLIRTILPLGTQSLFDYISGHSVEPEKIFSLLVGITRHVESLRGVLNSIRERVFVPVPTLHTIFIDIKGNIRSGLISLTIGSERKFVGYSGSQYALQADEWLVETVGLLFFELSSLGGCAVKGFTEIKRSFPDIIKDIGFSQGRLLLDILLKSTRAEPSSRYASIKYQLDDISEWSKLQTAINRNGLVSSSEQVILNMLWSMDMKIKRFLAKNTSGKENLIDLAFSLLHNNLINRLKVSELHLHPFLQVAWQEVSCNELYDKHIAATQSIGIARAINNKVEILKKALSLTREISFTKWLLLAAAGIELEALRRSCFTLVRELKINKEFNGFIVFLDKENIKNLSLSYKGHGDPFVDEIISLLQDNIQKISNRLQLWMSRPDVPPVLWEADLLIIQFIVLSKFYGLQINSCTENFYEIMANKKLFNVSNVNVGLFNILAVYRCENSNYSSTKGSLGIEYKMNTIIGINDINLHLIREMYRNHDLLHQSITGKVRFEQSVKLNIRHHKVSVDLRGNLVIEHIHNDFDAFHIRNCPFSIDMQYLNGKLIPITASFPVITNNSIEQELSPKLLKVKRHVFGLRGVIFQRRNPITAAFVDTHILWLMLTIILFSIAYAWILDDKSAFKQVVLNIFINTIAFATLGLYIKITYMRLRVHFKALNWISEALTK